MCFFLQFLNLLGTLRTTKSSPLGPLGAPELVKRGPFRPPENFDFGFEPKKNSDPFSALTWPFFIGFWLRIPKNDWTESRKKCYTPEVSIIS